MRKIADLFTHLMLYARAMAKWVILSVVVGLLCGLLGSAFHFGVSRANLIRETHDWVIYLLPVAGVLAVGVYRLFHTEGQGTNNILQEIQDGQGVSLTLIPAIFLTTVLTHLAGGSAGREGAALQMGGGIGYNTAKLLKLDDRDLRTATMVGMAAFFSALFGTPLGAAVFSLEVISVGLIYHAAFIPCFISSMTAYAVAGLLGISPERFAVTVPSLNLPMLLRVAVLAVLGGTLSALFCGILHLTEKKLDQWIPNEWLKALAGGAVILGLTLLLGRDYNGAGMGIIKRAIEEGQAVPTAFLWKMIFTAITLAVGFKGGEVVPSFFIGATFGCVAGPLLGLPAGFSAAVGLITVFCGAVNCPLASIFLAIELFGADGMLFYALGCGLSYVFSGYSGLYSSQRILYDKLKARFIDVRTNAYHEGE
ncbi:MAG: chloride channel protein [Anaerolineaceae bacterium]|nr:chloride channel protein [Anaerolineaceae bacterium]